MDFRNQVPPTYIQPDPILNAPTPGAPVEALIQQAPSVSTPIQAMPMANGAPVSSSSARSLKWLWWSIGGIVVAGIIGGGFFAYSKGYIRIPFLSPKEDQLFSKFVDSLSEINNAQYTVKVGLKSEPRSAGATSVFPSADERKAEANDAKRKSDISTIRTALTLYFDANNSTYPASLETTLVPEYLPKLPTDPKDTSAYQYESCSEGKHFLIQTGLESNEYYYLTDSGTSGTTDKVPACGQNTNVSKGLLRLFTPTAYAQATSFSIESIGSEIGLGAPESNYPMLGFLNIFGLGDLESVIDVFPTDIDANAAITFYAEADKQLQDANARLAINGSYRGDDLTVDFDVEGRKLGSTVYGIIRKFPGIPYISKYVSPIKNSWVKIEPGDGNAFLKADTFKQTSLKSGIESTRQSLKDALDGKIVTLDKTLGTETITGVQSAHYRVALHPENVKAVLEKIVADRKSKKLSTEALEDSIKQLNKPGTIPSLQRLADNSTVDIWVDKVKGYLRQMSWSVVLVPPDASTKLQGKQFRMTLTLTLDKVNQNVDVGRPGDAMNYDEAERKVTGISVEEQKFSRQRSQISSVRSALKQIFDINGTYPEKIDTLDEDLKKALADCKTKQEEARNTNTYKYVYCDTYLRDSQIIVKDIYTNKTYGYVPDGSDYLLTYEMKLNFEKSSSDYSYSSYYKDDYLEGKNVATSKDVSIEKETTAEISEKKYQAERNANTNKKTTTNLNTNTTTTNYWTQIYPCLSGAPLTIGDADKDGLNDYDEVYKYTTNSCLADTDGDTYSDKKEIDDGYNPIGPGKASSDQIKSWGPTSNPITSTAPKISAIKVNSTAAQTTWTWETDIVSDGLVCFNQGPALRPGDRNTYGTCAWSATGGDKSYSRQHQVAYPITINGATFHYFIRSCLQSATTVCTDSTDASVVIGSNP